MIKVHVIKEKRAATTPPGCQSARSARLPHGRKVESPTLGKDGVSANVEVSPSCSFRPPALHLVSHTLSFAPLLHSLHPTRRCRNTIPRYIPTRPSSGSVSGHMLSVDPPRTPRYMYSRLFRTHVGCCHQR